MKELLNKHMENLRKKDQREFLEIKSPFNQIKNTGEGYSSKLEQVEDRISGHKDKINIKLKTEELLDKPLKSCERNIQELSNSIKRTNLRITGLEEREEVQAKGICNILNKIKAENSKS
jgi:chromosome segregation ATPase